MLIGNLVGFSFGWIQEKTQVIQLDPENYYMAFVPIFWNWPIFLALNVLILIISTTVLFIPSMIISNVNPIKSIRFD